MVGELLAFLAEVLFHQGIHDDLLPDCVARDLPCELAYPSFLRLDVAAVASASILVVVLVHLQDAQEVMHCLD